MGDCPRENNLTATMVYEALKVRNAKPNKKVRHLEGKYGEPWQAISPEAENVYNPAYVMTLLPHHALSISIYDRSHRCQSLSLLPPALPRDSK